MTDPSTPAENKAMMDRREKATRSWITALLILVVITRIPFLLPGYGPDADSWLVANAATQLWQTGDYSPSRLPGYPLSELVSAPLVGLGKALLSNTATLTVSLLVVVVWWHIARDHAHHPRLAVLSLAFSPLLWTSSVVTMDYVWSLLFLLLAFLFALRNRPGVAGILAGLAAGFRLANIGGIVPLAILIVLGTREKKAAFVFLLTAGLAALLAYTPLLMHYGPLGWIEATSQEMNDVYPSLHDRPVLFLYRSIYAIGPLAAIAAAAILVRGRARLAQVISQRDPLLVASISAVVIFLLVFLGLPIERAYLLPALPFLILLVGRIATKPEFTLFALCLASLSIVNPDLATHNPPSPQLQPGLHRGRLLELWTERRDFLEARRLLAARQYPPRTVVMTGGDVTFWFENDLVEPDPSGPWEHLRHKVTRSLQYPGVWFVAYLSPEEVRFVREEGLDIVCPEPARKYVERAAQYRLEDLGIRTVTP
jgi:hypothetical protein